MIVVGASVVSSCKMAPKDDPGDTVAASVFAPVDTAALHRKQRAEKARLANAKDSIGIYYIGPGSTDIGHVVRVKFYVSKGDSLVQGLEEIKKQ